MPVTLAMLAIERSISAQRMTKVRPTAMTPVTDTWVRMLPTLSMVAKEWLATAKKAESTISVRNGAMLRICERRKLAMLRGLRPADGIVSLLAIPFTPSSRFPEAVLAHRLARDFTHHHAAPEHQDAFGQRQRRLRL